VALLLAPLAAAQDAGGGGSSGNTDPPPSAARFIVGALETGVARGLLAENASRAADPVRQAWSRFNTSLAGALPEVAERRALVDPLFARTLAEALALNATGARVYGNAVETCLAAALVPAAENDAAMGAIHAILSPTGASKWLHDGAHAVELGAPPQDADALRAWLSESALVAALRSEGSGDPVFARAAAGRAACLARAAGAAGEPVARLEARRDEAAPRPTPLGQASHLVAELGRAFVATHGATRVANWLVADDERGYAAAWARDPATAFARPCGLCVAGAILQGIGTDLSEASLIAGRESVTLALLMRDGESPAVLSARFAILRAAQARLGTGALERGPGLTLHVPPTLNATDGAVVIPVTLAGGAPGERFSMTLRANGAGGASFAGYASSAAYVHLQPSEARANGSFSEAFLDVVVDPWPERGPLVVAALTFEVPGNSTAWSVAVEAARVADEYAKLRPVARAAGTDGFDPLGAVFTRGAPLASSPRNDTGPQTPVHECDEGGAMGLCVPPKPSPQAMPFAAAGVVVALLLTVALARSRRRAG